MSTLPNIVEEVNRLMDEAQRECLRLRLIGGLAVRLHSQNVGRLGFQREYPDIDFVAPTNDHRRLSSFFIAMGYIPDRASNTLNGNRRQIYHDTLSGRHIDVFIGDFEMCHRLPMRDRLTVHPLTVPLAELFLSKSQIVELNRKDALDLITQLLDNTLGISDEGAINLDRIARLCARDWGLYTTTMMNLNRLEQILHSDTHNLNAEQARLVVERIAAIRQAMKQISKPLHWKARDRVGTRLRWYTEVEEVDR